MKQIPIFSLTKQYEAIRPELTRAMTRVFRTGMYTLGDEVTAFEQAFASYIGVPYAIGVASGTDALTLVIRSLDLSNQDVVLIPVNAYPTFFGIAMAGTVVRFVDCNESGNMSIPDLERRITKRTKAIVVVHLYGNPADILGVRRLLKKLHRTDIAVIEDCAQAHGAAIGKRRVGTFGDMAIFSFYPSKNLGAYGDGGLIVTGQKHIADRLYALRMYGETKRYESKEISGVSRLDELQAAILRVKLRHLDTWNMKRKKIAQLYEKELSNLDWLTVLPTEAGACHHLFVIRSVYRDALKTTLERNGIWSAIHYPIPLHMIQPCMHMGYRKGDFPVAERLSREILSLPMYPELTKKDLYRIISFILHIKKYNI